MNEVFQIRIGLGNYEFKIKFEGKVLKPSWHTRGPAQEALNLLEAGYGTVDEQGAIAWKPPIASTP